MALEASELLEYACGKFQDGNYDEALEAFVLAYSKGYEKEWIIENIYNCYMIGNEEIFQSTYNQNVSRKDISYEECILDFIPYRNGEYYIFDKELRVFRGIFSLGAIQNAEKDMDLQKVEFSPVALDMEWNFCRMLHVLTEARTRMVYTVCRDIGRGASFFKIPELTEYLKHIKLFSDHQELLEYFHKNTQIHLPKLVYGENPEQQRKLIDLLNKEHHYRLTPEGRNNNNVLLTIGIPTHNRGNLLLERLEKLCKLPYDAEIEFAISKNGMDLYQEEYERVGKMQDARIHYYDHGKELCPEENWHYVIEMAHGKYVLLVSDEDDVVPEALEHYLRLLVDHSETAIVRARGRKFYDDIEKRVHKKKGQEAFGSVFLRQNYLSGLILQREIFLQQNLMDLRKFAENELYHYYPHEWWCAILSMKGDYIEEPVRLIWENESVLEEEINKYQELGIEKADYHLTEEASLPPYATYEARLKQFEGQIGFLQFMGKIYPEILEVGLGKSMAKIAWLLEMAREYQYDCENFPKIVEIFLWMCMEAIDMFPLEEVQRANLLRWGERYGNLMLDLHEKLSAEQ